MAKLSRGSTRQVPQTRSALRPSAAPHLEKQIVPAGPSLCHTPFNVTPGLYAHDPTDCIAGGSAKHASRACSEAPVGLCHLGHRLRFRLSKTRAGRWAGDRIRTVGLWRDKSSAKHLAPTRPPESPSDLYKAHFPRLLSFHFQVGYLVFAAFNCDTNSGQRIGSRLPRRRNRHLFCSNT